MKRIVTAFALLSAAGFIAGDAVAQDKIQLSEFQVTFDSGGHSTPMVGKDSVGDLIVYSQYPIVNGVPGNASIYYQRVANGAPFGPSVTVADAPANQWLEDVSGDNIVYTLSPSIGAYGNIVLYQISTAQARVLTTAANAWEPRIFGDFVVWIEMTAEGGQVVLYQISSGTPVQTTRIAGPSPSASEAAIGDRLIAWSQFVNGRFQLAALDMGTALMRPVASDPLADLRVPSTNGPWIAYESRNVAGSVDIDLLNVVTGERRAVATNGSNQRPHISGDLLAYESNVLGNSQVFLYRIAEGDTFQVTTSQYDEHLNGILGNLVTYVDSRNGNDGVFASSISFSSSDTTPPTLTLPADVVTDATAPNGTSVTFSVMATDDVDRNPSVSCTPPAGSVFPIGATTVNCVATDSSGNSRTGSFMVRVKAAAQQVTDLVAMVNSFNLKRGIQNSLDVKLQNANAALTSANAGDRANVCGMLSAFINETNAQSGNVLTVPDATTLITAATRIRGVLACQ